MNNATFKNILFQGAFYAMACDGDIAAEEIATLREMVDDSLYFSGLDYDTSSEECMAQLQSDGPGAIRGFIDHLSGLEMRERQRFQFMEVLMKIVEADGEIEPSERHYLSQVRDAMGFTQDMLMERFPLRLGYFLTAEESEEFDANPYGGVFTATDQ